MYLCVYLFRYLFWSVMNTAVINAYILFMESFKPLTLARSKMTHLRFRLELCDQLTAGYSSRQRAGRKRAAPTIQQGNIPAHDLIYIDGRKKVCVNCSQLRRRTPSGRGIETRFQCRICSVPLCRAGCLVEFHTRHQVPLDVEE